jgi:prepilin-type N-terminal cleavage/methylation domain-containing protein
MKNDFRLRSKETFAPCQTQSTAGFTLIELLVVIAIIGVLSVIGIGVAKSATESAYKMREVNAARQLTAAFLSTTAEGDGTYLAGMDMRVNATTNPVRKGNGQIVANTRAAQRYPFRIAPYLGNNFNGTILVNKNIAKIQQIAGSSGSNYDYYVSTYPALGMNIYCVGGVVLSSGTALYNGDCITTPGRVQRSVLAFASAGSGKGSEKVEGYCYVTPPTLSNDSPICKEWGSSSSWSSSGDPMDFGNVDFRYGGTAVCAFLDGSVRMCSVKELNDMRLWSANAAEQDNATYSLGP